MKILRFALPCAAALLAGVASDATAAAQGAEASYRSGDYKSALRGFEAESVARGDDPRVFYNIGNCLFRLGRLPESVVAYKRALRRDPSDEAARFNLQLALAKLGAPPPPPDTFVLQAHRVVESLSPSALLTLTALLETAGLAVLVVGRRRRGLVGTGAAILVIAAGAFGAFLYRAYAEPATEGIVITTDARLRSEPREDLPTTLTLKSGETVVVEERGDRWLRVRYGDRSGWTEAATIGIVQ